MTITGTNFTGATAVKFGATNAASFTVNSATSITATSPAGSGTVDVTVTTVGRHLGDIGGGSVHLCDLDDGDDLDLVSQSEPPRLTPVTFTATVASGGGTPTGTVSFLDGATTIGTGTLAGGIATFTTSALTVGTHPITAVYGGSGNFVSSTSAVLSCRRSTCPPTA